MQRLVNSQSGKDVIVGKSELLGTVDIQDSTWSLIFKALKHTVDSGTAARVKLKGLDVYGKTGTAQNPHGPDHGWFMAFAGKEGQEPEIAVAVFVEYGEGGSSAAGPIAREMLKAYFSIQDTPKKILPKVTKVSDEEKETQDIAANISTGADD